MAKLSPETLELYKALNVVDRDLRHEIEHHTAQIGAKPFPGWTQEKHDEYHRKYLEEAKIAAGWVNVRQLRINPD